MVAIAPILACVVMAALGAASPARAQGFGAWFGDDRPRRAEPERAARDEPAAQPRPRKPRRASSKPAPAPGEPKPPVVKLARPLFAVVSIADQQISIYNHDGLVARSQVSTGMEGHLTPRGLFTILARERLHHSNIYSNAPMPFMQRITWSGVAMHQGVVPGHPASHGCIRLPAAFALKLWGMTRIGERVVISPDDVMPTEFSHSRLPVPKMWPKAETPPASTATASLQPVAGAAPPAPLNPRQYGEQIRTKAVADAAAASKTVKDRLAAAGAMEMEADRAEADVRAAERAQAGAQRKVDSSAAALEAVTAAAAARMRESLEAATEAKVVEEDQRAKARAHRAALVHEKAEIAKFAAQMTKSNAGAALAEANAKLEAARSASSAKKAAHEEALRLWREATAAADATKAGVAEASRRAEPVSVLISKKERKVYVRQGLAPIFDAPVQIREPENPLGTHLYIATAANEDGTSLRWTVLSASPQSIVVPSEQSGPRKRGADAEPALRREPSSASEALDRVEIAPDVRDRIAERLWTGASIIISDQPVSGETGNIGTDLTVKLR